MMRTVPVAGVVPRKMTVLAVGVVPRKMSCLVEEVARKQWKWAGT